MNICMFCIYRFLVVLFIINWIIYVIILAKSIIACFAFIDSFGVLSLMNWIFYVILYVVCYLICEIDNCMFCIYRVFMLSYLRNWYLYVLHLSFFGLFVLDQLNILCYLIFQIDNCMICIYCVSTVLFLMNWIFYVCFAFIDFWVFCLWWIE